MGKFMRKSKLTADMEISKSTLGVRTRAKTLALQRLHSQDSNYLQLRSRRLEKPALLAEPKKPITPEVRNCCSGKEAGSRALNSGSIESVNGFEGQEDEQFGEHDLVFEPIEGAIRGNTPADLISNVGNISTPGSSTRYPSLTAENRIPRRSILTNILSTCEVDDLFAHFEQQQQRFFMKKYNFDIINDIPLAGRYEWVKVNP